jgi:drug/metabolite transporter (DMT)-like permease
VCGAASAQSRPLGPRALPFVAAPPDPGHLARSAAIAGLVGAGLMFSGTLAIELADRPRSEGVTRGLHLGLTALAAPLVAYASYTVRRRESGEGVEALRAVGWAMYAAAIALGVAQFYDALHDRHIPTGLGYLNGGLAVMSLLPHCFDAYISARGARIPTLIALTPTGLIGTF